MWLVEGENTRRGISYMQGGNHGRAGTMWLVERRTLPGAYTDGGIKGEERGGKNHLVGGGWRGEHYQGPIQGRGPQEGGGGGGGTMWLVEGRNLAGAYTGGGITGEGGGNIGETEEEPREKGGGTMWLGTMMWYICTWSGNPIVYLE
jgi:hypothetical protein